MTERKKKRKPKGEFAKRVANDCNRDELREERAWDRTLRAIRYAPEAIRPPLAEVGGAGFVFLGMIMGPLRVSLSFYFRRRGVAAAAAAVPNNATLPNIVWRIVRRKYAAGRSARSPEMAVAMAVKVAVSIK